MKKIVIVLILLVAGSVFAQNKRLARELDASEWANNTMLVAEQGIFKTKTVAQIFALLEFETGLDTFTTTATADTVVISGALATDYYFVTGRGGSVDQQDVLQVEAKADTLIVHRLASGADGLIYNWLRIGQ